MQLLCLETHTPEWQHQRPTVSSSKPPLRTLSQSSPENPIKSNQTRALWDTLWGNWAGLAECTKDPVWACAERLPQTSHSASTFEKAAYALQETFSHLQEQDHSCLFYYKFKKANRSRSASKATVHTSDYKEINNGRSFYIEDWKGAVEYHSSLFITFANRPIATSNQE